MFACTRCGRFTALPTCVHCGHAFQMIGGAYQLTDDPGIQLDEGKGVQYIGYDRVGAAYSPAGPCVPRARAEGRKIAEWIGGGLLLDLGCGDGHWAVSAALNGCKVIAGDISNVMLGLLLERARFNGAPLDRIVPCRMNALSIPLAPASVDGVVANSLLHLISEPMVVIREIHRVLSPGGRLVFEGKSPYCSASTHVEESDRPYQERVLAFHGRYWELLKSFGVQKTVNSARFDQPAACEQIFGNRAEIDIPFTQEEVGTMADGFLRRMGGKGFSDQQGVPDDLHERVFAQVVGEFRQAHGPDFAAVTFRTVTNGLRLHVFVK